MKKLLLSAAVLAGVFASAQEASAGFEGKWFLSGQLNYSYDKTGDVKNTDFSVVPVVGTFVSPDVAVGLGVGYAHTKSEDILGGDTKSNAFIVQPLVRKYWGIADKFYIFGQASVPMQFGKEDEAKYTSFGVDVAPGIDYFLSNNWTIEAQFGGLGYNRTKFKDADEATNSFDLNLGKKLTFGVKYIF